MSLIQSLQTPEIKSFLQDHQIKHLWVFGSQAKNMAHPESDVDLLYELDTNIPRQPWGFIRAKNYIEKHLQKPCDMVNIKKIHPLIKEEVLSSKKSIW